MRFRDFLTGSGILFLANLTPGLGLIGSEASTSAAVRPAVQAPLLVELDGTGFERGLQHGKALKSEIEAAVRRWKEDLREYRQGDPEVLIAEFLGATNFLPAIRRWTPDLLEEVRGLSEASCQPFETILAYQLVDEIWVYFDEQEAHHCSGLGIARRGTRPGFVAQNLDLESFRHGTQTVLRIRRSGAEPEQLIFTSAGLIGAVGMNGAAVAVGANTLMQLRASRDGLPVAFLVRGLLARTSEASVLGFLQSVKHASGQNYIVGIRDKVYDFEASANHVVRYRPLETESPVYHTNHPLANQDLKPWHVARLEGGNSEVRYDSLRRRFGQRDSDLSERAIKQALCSRDSQTNPVCRSLRSGRSTFTFGSVVMTLSGTPSLQVTWGPPDAGEYQEYSFTPAAPKSPRNRERP